MVAKNRNFFGKNNPRYIDGRTLKDYFCKVCRKKISYIVGLMEQENVEIMLI